MQQVSFVLQSVSFSMKLILANPRGFCAGVNMAIAVVDELLELFRRPYDEQPEAEARYYAIAPPEALIKGGTAWMS